MARSLAEQWLYGSSLRSLATLSGNKFRVDIYDLLELVDISPAPLASRISIEKSGVALGLSFYAIWSFPLETFNILYLFCTLSDFYYYRL